MMSPWRAAQAEALAGTKGKNDDHEDEERKRRGTRCSGPLRLRTDHETAERRRDADKQLTDPNHVTLRTCSTPEFTTSNDVTLRTDRHAGNGEERVRSNSDDGTRSQQSLHPTGADDTASAGG